MRRGLILSLVLSLLVFMGCIGCSGGSSGGNTTTPALNVSSSAQRALANGSIVTITATPASGASPTSITFTITSGTGALDNDLQTKTVTVTNGSASVGLKATTPGTVEVTASSAVTSSGKTTVAFVQPASVVVDVGLKNSYANVYFLAFKLRVTSGSVNMADDKMTAVPINISTGLVKEPIKQGEPTPGVEAAIALTKSDTFGLGYNIAANTPVARMTFPVTGGIPTFSIIVNPPDGPVPLGITDPQNPASSTKPPLTAADFSMTVTYKDALGNTL